MRERASEDLIKIQNQAAALRSSNEQQGLRSTGGGGQRTPTSPAASLLQQEKTRVGPRTATEPRGEDFLGRANCAPSFLQSNGWGTEEPGRLQSMESQESNMTKQLNNNKNPIHKGSTLII